MQQFQPMWLTIPEFAGVHPSKMYHKENEEGDRGACTARNLHVLARAWVKDWEGGRQILRLTADDYYKLYVNGRFVTQGPAPAYVEHYYYDTVDITPYLRTGGNVIGVHLYYQGLVNRVWNSGDGRLGLAAGLYGERGGLARELHWTYKVSRAYSGEVTGYDTQFLEDFDSRRWEPDWACPEYCGEGWQDMVIAPWADYSLQERPVKQLSVYRVNPAQVRRNADSWFIDMGREITGALRIKAEGPKGAQVAIRCGEEQDHGQARHDMRCNCRYEETWTLDEGICELEPYDYKGFRYASLTPGEGVRILEVYGEARHYPMDDSCCTLESSCKDLDGIFSICRRGVKLGTQEGYLDCPTREKGQYLGDAVVTAHSQVWLTGTVEMLRKCIRQFAWTRTICPGLMGVAPGSLMQEIADFSLLWSQLLTLDYSFTGDKEFLESCIPAARGILEHFGRYAGEDGLLYQVADKWNLVDWPENLRDGYDFPLTRPVVAPGCHNVINALYIGAARTLAELEEILGMEPSMDWRGLKESYIRTFFRKDRQLFADSSTSGHCALHSNVYALYFGLMPEAAKEHIADFLVEKGMCCGVMVSYFYLKALAKAGRYKELYSALVNDSEHGWVNMLREGATACFEAWGKEQKWNTSLCHPWASAPIPVFIEDIAGFLPDPAQPQGFRFSPHVPAGLPAFRLKLPFRGREYLVEKRREEAGTVRCYECGKDGSVELLMSSPAPASAI